QLEQLAVQSEDFQLTRSIEAIAALGLEGSGAVRGEIFEGSKRSLLERVRAGRPQLAHGGKDAAASGDLFVAGAGDALFVFACAAGEYEQRSEEHTSELQYLVISYAVFCLKKKREDNKRSMGEPAPARRGREAGHAAGLIG